MKQKRWAENYIYILYIYINTENTDTFTNSKPLAVLYRYHSVPCGCVAEKEEGGLECKINA